MTDTGSDFSWTSGSSDPQPGKVSDTGNAKIPPLPAHLNTDTAVMTDAKGNKEKQNPSGRIPAAVQNGLLVLLLAAVFLLFGWHCPFHWMTGIPCPGCGMTRALIALGNGFLTASLYWHPLLIPTLAVFALCALLWLMKQRAGISQADRISKAIRILILVWAAAMLLVWLWRLCFFFPGEYGWFITPLFARLFG